MPAADPLLPLLDLPGVSAGVEQARTDVDRLLGHRLLRRRSAEISAESALRGARASAALAGAAYPLAEVRAGGLEDPVLTGALRVSTGLGRLTETWTRAPLQVLARLHVLAVADQVPAERLGRPVSDPQVTGRLSALAALLTGGTQVPAVVLAAVVHGELLALAPFGTGDGLVARGAARLTLIARGLDPKAVSVPEVGHLAVGDTVSGEGYDEAAAGYRSGSAEGVAAWLRHCCAASAHGAVEGVAVCEALLRG